MNRYQCLWVIAVLAAWPGEPAWAQSSGGRGQSIVSGAALAGAGYGKYWDGRIPLSPRDAVVAVHLLDENLYVRSRDGIVYAIQTDTGLLRWGQPLNDHVFRDRPPTHVQTDEGDGPVVFVSRGQVLVLDRYSGDVVRRIELPFVAGGAAVADRFNMYLGGADGKFYALRWSADLTCTALNRWLVDVEGAVLSGPMLTFDNRLYFVSDAGVVYCVDPRTKSLHWAYRIGAGTSGGVHVDESGVYVACADHRLYVLDRDDGSLILSYHLPGPLFETPVVAQRTVYQYCDREGLFAFDVDTRKALWHMPRGRRFVSRAAERLVLMTDDGDLLLVDNDTGKVQQSIDLPDGVMIAENRRDAVLFMVTVDGRLLCAKPLGFPYLRRESVAAARAALHRPPLASGGEGDALLDKSIDRGKSPAVLVQDPLRSTGGR